MQGFLHVQSVGERKRWGQTSSDPRCSNGGQKGKKGGTLLSGHCYSSYL